MESPSVGRIIHFMYADECRAAIITGIQEDAVVSLCVFNPQGLAFIHTVDYDEERTPATWHWPERK